MKVQERKIYRCDYCPKYYISERHAIQHEKYCRKNPANDHKCFQYCNHLKRTQEEIEGPYGICGHETVFTCMKHNKEMWSYIAERRDIQTDADERMPLECGEYETNIEYFDH